MWLPLVGVPASGDLAHDTAMWPEWKSNQQPLVYSPALSPLTHTSQGYCFFFFHDISLIALMAPALWKELACENEVKTQKSDRRRETREEGWSQLNNSGYFLGPKNSFLLGVLNLYKATEFHIFLSKLVGIYLQTSKC